MTMLAPGLLAVTVACLAVTSATGCASQAGPSRAEAAQNESARRTARTVAQAVAHPRQTSTEGLVRAIRATKAARTQDLLVMEAQDLEHQALVDPSARIRILIDVPGGEGTNRYPPLRVCYDLFFNYYGPTGEQQVDCPATITIVPTPPAPSPTPRDVIATGSDEALVKTLRDLPPGPTTADVVTAVTSALPAPGTDPGTGLRYRAPQVRVAVAGANVGVAVWSADDRSCLLGTRMSGSVDVGFLSREDVQPGERTCDGQAALDASGRAPTSAP